MFRKFVSILTVFAFICTSLPCYADDSWTFNPAPVITPLSKGQSAPYAGVLLTPEAVAKIIASAQDCPKRIKVESEHARDTQKALDDKELNDVKANAEHDKKILEAKLVSRDGQIKDLTTALQKSEESRKNTWFLLGSGALAGILVTIGTVILVSYAK